MSLDPRLWSLFLPSGLSPPFSHRIKTKPPGEAQIPGFATGSAAEGSEVLPASLVSCQCCRSLGLEISPHLMLIRPGPKERPFLSNSLTWPAPWWLGGLGTGQGLLEPSPGQGVPLLQRERLCGLRREILGRYNKLKRWAQREWLLILQRVLALVVTATLSPLQKP